LYLRVFGGVDGNAKTAWVKTMFGMHFPYFRFVFVVIFVERRNEEKLWLT